LSDRVDELYMPISAEREPLAIRREGETRQVLMHTRRWFDLRRLNLRIVGLLTRRALSPRIDPCANDANLRLASTRVILRRHLRLNLAGQHANHEARISPMRNNDRTLFATLLQLRERHERELALEVVVVVAA